MAHLHGVDPEEVALDLYAELDALEVEEVWDRSGANRYGYVEPAEAAAEMIEQVLAPFLQDLQKYQAMGLPTHAKEVCIGLLLGLYQFEHESTNEFKDWAVDAPAEFAREIIDRWRNGLPSQADVGEVKQFINNQLDGWVTWRQ